VNVLLLIDSVVRQVTVLLAQLATSGGVRAPVAHIANQVFMELSRELAAQGVSRKVTADMFGMALRTYQRKLRRLNESSTDAGRTLWQAVLDFVAQRDLVTRDEVLRRFARDDETQVRAVLHDLNESGLLFASGAGSTVSYRAASEADLAALRQQPMAAGLDELIWALVYREGPLTRSDLVTRGRMTVAELDAVLARLIESGRVVQVGAQLRASDLTIPLDAQVGWEAAVFDHLQAMVQTICQRLAAQGQGARGDDTVGGSTYSFDIWAGHPFAAEVRGLLARFRAEHSALSARVIEHNREHALPERYEQVVFYGGQCALERGTSPEHEGEQHDDA
jgi:hypothetical protein